MESKASPHFTVCISSRNPVSFRVYHRREIVLWVDLQLSWVTGYEGWGAGGALGVATEPADLTKWVY